MEVVEFGRLTDRQRAELTAGEEDPVAMWRPIREGVTLPSGRVTVHSLPF
jgi:hypothetical protein